MIVPTYQDELWSPRTTYVFLWNLKNDDVWLKQTEIKIKLKTVSYDYKHELGFL